MRKKGVPIVQLSKRVLASMVASFLFSLPALANPALLATWFPLPSSPGCNSIEPKRMHEYEIADPVLVRRLGEIRTAIQERNAIALTALFHPRLQMQAEKVVQVFQVEESTVGARHEVSDYELWALRPQEKDHNQIQCESEPIVINTLYGYPLQMAYWVQSSGSEDLGRFFMLLVQDRTTWRIGAFRFQRWTYLKKNAEGWAAAADLAGAQKKPLEAFFQRDLAQKLLAGETLFTLPAVQSWKELQERTFSTAMFEAQVQKNLGAEKPLYIAPALSPNGHSLLLRFEIKEEWASTKIRAHCAEIAGRALKAPAFSFLQGVRCGYLFPGEPAAQDGKLGSVYVER